ncbi:MAG: glycosyl hydrolase 115 family protein, partial [Lachnospiraceae bacterium]|nr:glycosyl hydrolase 115 family protein [Lachnospiraceae bacterium]
MDFEIIVNSVSAELLVEDSADEGVKKIADVIADDIESVCDKRPYIAAFTFECMFDRVIVFATVGKSAILSRLEENGIVDTSVIKDRRESFMIFGCDFSAIDADRTGQVLVVAGSDKRGTIYGMFKISEAIGVTSLVYWGDSEPVKKTDVMLTKEWLLKDRAIKESSENIFISKQPSVEYRGFFINDEWPAFGGWSRDRFGGFNAKCYRELFIFLLRMRGNFLWPAMWSSVFSEDGPGIESARLADTLGIIMGTSHHEPLCRAGEEWQHIYKDYSESNAWNFINNKEGITNFWRDGLLRNKKFENLITIGMRGEADSKLLGEDATMADNIKVIKDAILTQHKLLKECVNEDLTKIPRVLAIYKEVEDYYYGDETCEGLKDWDELKDVIFLLSDDNWANTRGLPKQEEREHPGGYGMYYHFDYHGGPISYEWQNTSRLSKIWEQMTQAYEYGVRREWIVNVGDLKGNEYPLTYFMALAYDYETWSGFDMIDTFVSEWVDEHFHADISACKEKLLRLIEGATRYNALRKPESLSSFTYAPVSFDESRHIMDEVSELLDICEELKDELTGSAKTAYMSMFYYQIKGSLNIHMIQLEAGINAYLAKNRSIGANIYADKAAQRTVLMGELIDEYNAFLG